ncbi:MAG: DUF922 domain-containing protein [Chitinophagales bacterium]
MKSIILVSVILFSALNFAFVFPKEETTELDKQVIHWKEGNPLSWNDFIGRTKTFTSISALTASAIEYAYECSDNDVSISVKAIFIPEDSWVKADAMNDYVLGHEQLHFDITEVYARKLRKELNTRITTCRDIKNIESIANSVIKEWKKEQAKYDADSKHSMDKELQALWAKKVRQDLANYKAYSL